MNWVICGITLGCGMVCGVTVDRQLSGKCLLFMRDPKHSMQKRYACNTTQNEIIRPHPIDAKWNKKCVLFQFASTLRTQKETKCVQNKISITLFQNAL